MGENTAIEWADHTFNAWIGCTKVSPGCANCYAEARSARWGDVEWGPGKERRRTSEANWRKPLSWDRAAARDGVRPRVFCASLADWLDDEAPISWLADLLALIGQTPNLDWLLLTKRPQEWLVRMRDVVYHLEEEERRHLDADGDPKGLGDGCFARTLARQWICDEAPANVWVGTTVEDQRRADERIPQLLEIPARVRFLSCEPLLGPVDLEAAFSVTDAQGEPSGPRCNPNGSPAVGWVICGGESGAGARPMHPEWARSLRDQCVEAGVAFHFKQWGAWEPFGQGPKLNGPPPVASDVEWLYEDGRRIKAGVCAELPVGAFPCGVRRVGKGKAGRELDGRTWDEVPR